MLKHLPVVRETSGSVNEVGAAPWCSCIKREHQYYLCVHILKEVAPEKPNCVAARGSHNHMIKRWNFPSNIL